MLGGIGKRLVYCKGVYVWGNGGGGGRVEDFGKDREY